MVSVNIDKLLPIKDNQEASYKDIANSIMEGGKNKTVSFLGTPMVAFTIAAKLAKDNKVIVVDGDFTTTVFLSKYKLGKDLVGVCDYICNDKNEQEILCKTNKDNLDIAFTGNNEVYVNSDENLDRFKGLLEIYKNDYDYVIVASNADNNSASRCDETIVIMSEKDYQKDTYKEKVEAAIGAGCNCIGIILENCA